MPSGDKNRKLSDADRAEVVRLYTTQNPDGTWTGAPSIARRFGVTPTAITVLLKTRGIHMRTSAQAFAHSKRTKPITNLPQGSAPNCKCGCGQPATWNQRKNHWNLYADGHYRQDAPYKNPDWLRRAYCEEFKSLTRLADELGVAHTTIRRFMRAFGIPMRTQRETLALGGRVAGANNPAWKGGIAKWEYAPDWKRIARAIRKRDNYTCQKCKTQFPKSSKLLHVHHIDGHKFHNSDDNLITVCAACHPKGKRKETRAAFLS